LAGENCMLSMQVNVWQLNCILGERVHGIVERTTALSIANMSPQNTHMHIHNTGKSTHIAYTA